MSAFRRRLIVASAALVSACSSSSQPTPPLTAAVDDGTPDVVRRMLEDGADPNESSFGGPPLWQAILAEDPETVRILLDAGADATYSEGGTNYVLLVALDESFSPGVQEGATQVLDLVVAYGADPCARAQVDQYSGMTASEIAELRGRTDLAMALEVLEQDCL